MMRENKKFAAARGTPQTMFFDDGDWVCARELFLRCLCRATFRLAITAFVSAQLWDFLFSPIWMHGYLWSLNQHCVSEQGSMGADKSAVSLLDQQMAQVGFWERSLHSFFATLAVWVLLCGANFSRQQKSVWTLFRLAFCAGMVIGLARAVQMRQRLLPCVHECFFGVVEVFVLGLCLTLGKLREEQPKNGPKKTQ